MPVKALDVRAVISIIISTISPGTSALRAVSFQAYLALNKIGMIRMSKSKPHG